MGRKTSKAGAGKRGAEQATDPANPAEVRNTTDPGDSTARNYRYQYGFGAILLIAARCGDRPYVAIWCEHHEDFLAEFCDGCFDGYQVKTSRPELGAWTLRDPELVKSIGRFVDLVMLFGDRIRELFFVSNTECDRVTAASTDQRRRGACPQLFLAHVRGCSAPSDIQEPFRTTFSDLQGSCGCEAGELLAVLRRMNIIHGPSRTEFEATLSHEHLPRVDGCKSLTPQQLDAFRDDLIAIVHRASSLQVTDPRRHIRALIDGETPDPVLVQKRLVVEEVVVYRGQSAQTFQFLGAPTLALGDQRQGEVLEQKLKHGGLDEEVDYMRDRERAAEYHLFEDFERRPDRYPALLRQLEQMVLGECTEAHLRARRLADERPEMVGHHSYECLIGIAGLLTSDCRVWWSPRFPLRESSVL
jgi:hypothetical protein